MADGLLEYEIRRLPDVLAAAVDHESVTVLVQPTADADAVQAVLAAMLATASLDRTITVLGGTSFADVRSRRLKPLVGGSIAGAGLLVSAAAAAALTGGLPVLPLIDQPAEPAPVAPAVAAPAPAPGPRSWPSRLIVPGGQPDWAAAQPPIELPPVAEAPMELAVAVAEAPPPPAPDRLTRPAKAKLAHVVPPPLVPTAVAPEPSVAPVVVVPEVEVPPLLEVPTLDVPVRAPKADREERPRPEPRIDDDEPEVVTVGEGDDRHRNQRGRGHGDNGNGNGRGRGHETGEQS